MGVLIFRTLKEKTLYHYVLPINWSPTPNEDELNVYEDGVSSFVSCYGDYGKHSVEKMIDQNGFISAWPVKSKLKRKKAF